MYVYKITFPNGKIYIGQTIFDNPKYMGSGVACLAALKYYGKENCTKDILRRCNNQKQLDVFEAFYIKKYDSTNKKIGYNILPGTSNAFGSGSPMHIPEVLEKCKRIYAERKGTKKWIAKNKLMSIRTKKRYKERPELRPIGEKNGMYGKTHTKERKKEVSDFFKEYFSKEENKQKLSEDSIRNWEKLRQSGKAEEVIRKRAETKKRGVLQLDMNTHEVLLEHKSAQDIEDEFGYCRMNIGKCCRDNRDRGKGLIYHRYGYKWIYNE